MLDREARGEVVFIEIDPIERTHKWPNVKGGCRFQWVGYWIDQSKYKVSVSKNRITWMLEWSDAVLDDKVPTVDFDSGLGRLSFICGALAYDRPFLAAL